jgi:hypothetical protein
MFWDGSSKNDTQTAWCAGQTLMTHIFFYVCTPYHRELAIFTFNQRFLYDWLKQDFVPHKGFIFL